MPDRDAARPVGDSDRSPGQATAAGIGRTRCDTTRVSSPLKAWCCARTPGRGDDRPAAAAPGS